MTSIKIYLEDLAIHVDIDCLTYLASKEFGAQFGDVCGRVCRDPQ
jgi:hypothetical protein